MRQGDEEAGAQVAAASTAAKRNHDPCGVQLVRHSGGISCEGGDYIITLEQDNARYAVEMLEPQGHDSFFRWGFFNSVLEKKEAYSDYVFEDHALELLRDEPGMKAKFDTWKGANTALVSDQNAALDFFANCQRYRGPEWSRYPVFMLA